eukprot:604928-Hanusia_phi.AAC.1
MAARCGAGRVVCCEKVMMMIRRRRRRRRIGGSRSGGRVLGSKVRPEGMMQLRKEDGEEGMGRRKTTKTRTRRGKRMTRLAERSDCYGLLRYCSAESSG